MMRSQLSSIQSCLFAITFCRPRIHHYHHYPCQLGVQVIKVFVWNKGAQTCHESGKCSHFLPFSSSAPIRHQHLLQGRTQNSVSGPCYLVTFFIRSKTPYLSMPKSANRRFPVTNTLVKISHQFSAGRIAYHPLRRKNHRDTPRKKCRCDPIKATYSRATSR